MNVGKERKRKRIFAAVILALMTVLAVGVAVFADAPDSYALTIVKKIDENGLPEDVLKWAKDQEYTFRIDGFGYVKGEVKSFRELLKDSMPEGVRFVEGNDNALLVTIKGEGSRMISFGTAVAATVSEVTNGLKYDDGKNVWNMSETTCDASMPTKLVYGTNMGTGSSRDLTINIGKDGGKIKVSKPENAKLVGYFRPRKKEEASAGSSLEQSGRSGEGLPIKSIGPGEYAEWDGLDRGSYIIEKMEGARGFSVHVGQRKVDVPKGGEGTVYINGNYGKLTITAPGVRGGGEQYYYVISGKTIVKDENGNDREELYERTTSPVKAGEEYQVDHLPRGRFTVKEHNYSPTQGFTVTGVNVDGRVKTLTKKVNQSKLNTWRWVDSLPEDLVSNAQVEISQIKGPKVGTSVKFGIGGTWDDEPSKEKLWSYACKVGTPRTIETREMLPGSRILFNWNGNGSISEVVVKFYYDREIEMKTSCKDSDVLYAKTISQDWMEISKAVDDTPEGEIYYYYTILDKDDQPITGYSAVINGVPVSESDMTDREGTAVRIKAGDTVRLEGLKPGSYKIMETIDADEPAAFQMAVEETESTISPASAVDVEILGPRTLTIKRDEDRPGEEMPDLVYAFQVSAKQGEFIDEVTLKAGESAQVDLPGEGQYTVKELDRSEIFELSYTDSGTVGVMTTTKAWSSRSFFDRAGEGEPDTSTVTFTNSFSKEEGAYRVIHEYYFQDKYGDYHCEGTSIMTSETGRRLGSEYTEDNVIRQFMFSKPGEISPAYAYFESAYGTAEEIGFEEAELSSEPVQFRMATGSNIATRSNGKARANRVSRPSREESSGGIRIYGSIGANGAKAVSIASSSDGERELPDDEEMDLAGRRASRSSSVKGSLGREAASPLNDKGVDPDEIEADDEGIISRGVVTSGGKTLAYTPDEGMDHVTATEEGNQVIILRYFWKYPVGNYKVLHMYYLRDKDGDHREGNSQVIDKELIELNEANREYIHTAGSEDQIPQPLEYYLPDAGLGDEAVENVHKYEYTYFGYSYGKVISGGDPDPNGEWYIFGDVYQPDTTLNGVKDTEAGDQMIVLRYYRKEEDTTSSVCSYRVVHEYYYREEADIGQAGEEEGDNAPGEEDDGYPGDDGPEGGEEDGFNGTMPKDPRYSDTFEGMTEIEEIIAPKNTTVTADQIGKKEEFSKDGKKHKYTYYHAGSEYPEYGEMTEEGSYPYTSIRDKQFVTSTPEGKQIIILRYVRGDEEPKEPEKPEEPEKPQEPETAAPPQPERPARPSGGGGGGGERDRTPSSAPDPSLEVTTEPPSPEAPSEPEPTAPGGLPDPQDPNSPETITIWEDGVPRTYRKVWDPETGTFVYLPEDEIPLSGKDLPKTGDRSGSVLWLTLFFLSGAGGILLIAARRRGKRKR